MGRSSLHTYRLRKRWENESGNDKNERLKRNSVRKTDLRFEEPHLL